ncbi:hypothetical protein [Streptomyces albidoflavus]|uniref:hypothetical protein n=1 Tax=Streptomyces albidoflavus TaxID=1886 RepID=UPI0033DB1A1A
MNDITINKTHTYAIAQRFLDTHPFLSEARRGAFPVGEDNEWGIVTKALEDTPYNDDATWFVEFTDPTGRDLSLTHRAVMGSIRSCVYDENSDEGVTRWVLRLHSGGTVEQLGTREVSVICQRALFNGREPYTAALFGPGAPAETVASEADTDELSDEELWNSPIGERLRHYADKLLAAEGERINLIAKRQWQSHVRGGVDRARAIVSPLGDPSPLVTEEGSRPETDPWSYWRSPEIKGLREVIKATDGTPDVVQVAAKAYIADVAANGAPDFGDEE